MYAEALALHFGTLEHELERLASRPQVDLLDENLQPERELLEFTHHNSPFFSAVLFLDGSGLPVWSEPRGVLPPISRANDRWFQRLLRTSRPVVDALEPGSRSFVVAAPVLRGDRLSGAVVGLVDAGMRGLPGGPGHHRGLGAGGLHRPRRRAPSGHSSGLDLRRGFPRAAGGPPPPGPRRDHRAVRCAGVRRRHAGGRHGTPSAARRRGERRCWPRSAGASSGRCCWCWWGRRSPSSSSAGSSGGPTAATARWTSVLAQQEKLAALGQAASLIAHEVKNSLNGMKVAASMLVRRRRPDAPGEDDARADRPAQPPGHLAAQLRQAGRRAARRSLRWASWCSEAVESLRVLPEAEEVEVDVRARHLAPRPLRSAAPGHRAGQPPPQRDGGCGGGQGPREGRPAPVCAITTRRVDGAVRVEVEDNAGGPPPGFEAGLFQPFVTTQAEGHRARALHGSSGGGTTGRVAGVRANGDGEPLHGAARAGNDSLMSRSILLVDDDRGFSSLAQAALAREGHPVVLARSLHEAREAVERAAPELVVLDRRPPGRRRAGLPPRAEGPAPGHSGGDGDRARRHPERGGRHPRWGAPTTWPSRWT